MDPCAWVWLVLWCFFFLHLYLQFLRALAAWLSSSVCLCYLCFSGWFPELHLLHWLSFFFLWRLQTTPLQSISCRYCKAKLIFSVLGYSITLSETTWGGAIKMYEPFLVRRLEDAWKSAISTGQALYALRHSVSQQSHDVHRGSTQAVSCIIKHSKCFHIF